MVDNKAIKAHASCDHERALLVLGEMEVCVVDQCLTNPMVGKGTRLYRIPKVRAHYGEYELELS